MGKSQDTRFVKRILTPSERKVLIHCDPSTRDIILWSFWAGKETGYKIASKRHSQISSSPQKYEIKLSNNGMSPLEGTVISPEGCFPLRFFINSSCIHCVGVSRKPKNIDILFYNISPSPNSDCNISESEEVRTFAKQDLSINLEIPMNDIHIYRPKGADGQRPPQITISGKHTGDISLSHHGKFIAYAFYQPDYLL